MIRGRLRWLIASGLARFARIAVNPLGTTSGTRLPW
jgi:hypothetical protein